MFAFDPGPATYVASATCERTCMKETQLFPAAAPHVSSTLPLQPHIPLHHSAVGSCSVLQTPLWVRAEPELEALPTSRTSKCLQIPLFPIKLPRKFT